MQTPVVIEVRRGSAHKPINPVKVPGTNRVI
jgi:hypothetical protein